MMCFTLILVETNTILTLTFSSTFLLSAIEKPENELLDGGLFSVLS